MSLNKVVAAVAGLATVAHGSLWVDEAPDYVRPYGMQAFNPK
jgi:hypothetical protein